MFEHHNQKILPRKKFLLRLAKYGLISVSLLIGSLFIGMIGYHLSEGLSWIDAFLNSAMLMGGMGPVNTLHSDAGKLFAGFYALYCGMVLLIAVAIFLAPIFHRFLHHFHLENPEEEKEYKAQERTFDL